MPRSLKDIPLELLAAICDELPSPREVLALARTSSYLYSTLAHSSNAAIWRRARKRCPGGPVPDPPEYKDDDGCSWTEPSYAAFVFDGGTCEVCGRTTNKMFFSFAIRARICGSSACRQAFFSDHLIFPLTVLIPAICNWLPYVELLAMGTLPNTVISGRYYRKKDYLAAIDEYHKSARDPLYELKDRTVEKARLPLLIEHSKKLTTFRIARERQQSSFQNLNRVLTREVASTQGWEVIDLLNAPSYDRMLATANVCVEPLNQAAVDLMIPQLRTELVELRASRANRTAERARQQRTADIALAHQRLVSAVPASPSSFASPPRICVPPLAAFRKLPVIEMLQEKNAASVKTELTSDATIRGLITDALERWTKSAREGLARVLGVAPNWADPSARVIHPVDRLDARFVCSACEHVAARYAAEGSMDFAGACAHECFGDDGKKCSRKDRCEEPWTADKFVRDDAGADVIQRAAAIAHIKLEHVGARGLFDAIGTRWACGACKVAGGIVMPFERLIGHAKRHSIPMPLTLLTPAQAAARLAGEWRYLAGVCKQYLHPKARTGVSSHTRNSVRKAREGKNFVCRHCFGGSIRAEDAVPGADDTLQDAQSSTSLDSNGADEGNQPPSLPPIVAPVSTSRRGLKYTLKKPVPMTFDGLICHAQVKHAIAQIGDEDFYVVGDMPLL